MSSISKQQTPKRAIPLGKQRNYDNVVALLNAWWPKKRSTQRNDRIKKLDKALGSPAQKVDTIFIKGTNGKSLTAHFASRLLHKEGLSVGVWYAPHILTYNERFVIDNETISNKAFTDLANEVINTAETENLKVDTWDILTAMAYKYFSDSNVNVALLELDNGDTWHPATWWPSKIIAITRLTAWDTDKEGYASKKLVEEYLDTVDKGTHVVSADQNKTNLKTMSTIVKASGGIWAMPIRKLAPLSYPFEQLHGRCAALAERIASLYINIFAQKGTVIVSESLLTKKEGKRGRPTTETKRQSELNPKKTVEQFWQEISSDLPGRFQLLEKEKPTILLDNASNIDAIKNLLLGIRLLHYQRPLKGFAIILGHKDLGAWSKEMYKTLRYFFKKTSGMLITCPVIKKHPWHTKPSWDAEKATQDLKKDLKIKVRPAKTFKEAYEIAKKATNERDGLIVIAGSDELITEYWEQKGVKKLS